MTCPWLLHCDYGQIWTSYPPVVCSESYLYSAMPPDWYIYFKQTTVLIYINYGFILYTEFGFVLWFYIAYFSF